MCLIFSLVQRDLVTIFPAFRASPGDASRIAGIASTVLLGILYLALCHSFQNFRSVSSLSECIRASRRQEGSGTRCGRYAQEQVDLLALVQERCSIWLHVRRKSCSFGDFLTDGMSATTQRSLAQGEERPKSVLKESRRQESIVCDACRYTLAGSGFGSCSARPPTAL